MALTPCSHCDLLTSMLIICVAFFMVALLTLAGSGESVCWHFDEGDNSVSSVKAAVIGNRV